MKVIIACINGQYNVPHPELFRLKSVCKKLNLEMPMFAHTPLKLLELLEASRGDSYLLFSNFPPNSSYPGSGESIHEVDMGSYIQRYWVADSYSKSKALFENLLTDFSYKALHFITGAPSCKISDEYLKSIAPNTHTTITRRGVFIGKSQCYDHLLCSFIIQKIKEVQSLHTLKT